MVVTHGNYKRQGRSAVDALHVLLLLLILLPPPLLPQLSPLQLPTLMSTNCCCVVVVVVMVVVITCRYLSIYLLSVEYEEENLDGPTIAKETEGEEEEH